LKKNIPASIHKFVRIFTFKPTFSRKRALIYFTVGILFFFFVEIMFLFVNFPISGIRMKPLSILYSIPMLFFIGLGCLGVEYIKNVKNSWFFQAWLCAILSSFFYSLVTVNTTLFPDRHVEYLTVPVCLLASVGVLYFFRFKDHRLFLSIKKQFSYLV
jgi:hypothetical protein